MTTDNSEVGRAETAGKLIDALARVLAAAPLHYGHGTDNPLDEAAALVFHVMSLDHNGAAELYATPVQDDQRAAIGTLLEQRIRSRTPMPYLLGEAWFCGHLFEVDSRVLIPRSPIAELIGANFEPWVDPASIRRVLEIGTGSGCIAIACALALPDASVTATDISADALEVAAANVSRHGVGERVTLIRTDHADGVQGEFDLIVTNPPYVPLDEMTGLPEEFDHEPALGLVSGADGLDSARRILQDAPSLLSKQGVLVLEVGAQWQALERAFPTLPFTWLEFEHGGIGVALLQAGDLSAGVPGK